MVNPRFNVIQKTIKKWRWMQENVKSGKHVNETLSIKQRLIYAKFFIYLHWFGHQFSNLHTLKKPVTLLCGIFFSSSTNSILKVYEFFGSFSLDLHYFKEMSSLFSEHKWLFSLKEFLFLVTICIIIQSTGFWV